MQFNCALSTQGSDFLGFASLPPVDSSLLALGLSSWVSLFQTDFRNPFSPLLVLEASALLADLIHRQSDSQVLQPVKLACTYDDEEGVVAAESLPRFIMRCADLSPISWASISMMVRSFALRCLGMATLNSTTRFP